MTTRAKSSPNSSLTDPQAQGQDADTLAHYLTPTEQPYSFGTGINHAAEGGRLLLNAYGRRCYDAGVASMRARVAELEREVAELKKERWCCVHCLGPVEPSGKCKNDRCIGAEFSYENPDGWPK